MSRRVLHGLCGAALAAASLVGGSDLIDAQAPAQGRAVQGGGVHGTSRQAIGLAGKSPDVPSSSSRPWGTTRARQRESSNLQGKYWIGTVERYQGRGEPGGIQGDEPQGTLTSTRSRFQRR